MQNIALDTQNNISIFFAGDFCVDQPVKPSFIQQDVQDFICNHDFRWCNFEAPLQTEAAEKIIKAGPHKCQDKSIDYLVDKNVFNIFGLANNHIMDYGKEALHNTISTLENKKVKFHGAALSYDEAYKPLILEKNGIKIALIALCENQFGCLDSDEKECGYAWLFNPVIPELIKSTKVNCDFLIVLPHAGLEMYTFPLPELRAYYKQLVNYGADLIVGNHPHVIQGKEQHKGKNIYYSLGNFFFNYKGKTEEQWYKGLGLSCVISNEGEITIEEKVFESYNSELRMSETNGSETLKALSQEFKDEVIYLKKVNEAVVDLWEKSYKMYSAVPHLNGEYYQSNIIIKRVFYHFFSKFLSPENNTLLLHNYKIETNRFVIQRALKLLSKTY